MQAMTAEDHFKIIRERRERFIREHTPAWRERGQRYRAIREAAGLSLAGLAEQSGFSAGKLRSFEHGEPGHCTKAVEMAYRMAAKLRMVEIREALN